MLHFCKSGFNKLDNVAASVYMFYVTIYIYYNYNITLTSLLFTIVMFK